MNVTPNFGLDDTKIPGMQSNISAKESLGPPNLTFECTVNRGGLRGVVYQPSQGKKTLILNQSLDRKEYSKLIFDSYIPTKIKFQIIHF